MENSKNTNSSGLSEKNKSRIQKAEEEVADYLIRCGYMEEKGIQDKTRAEALQKRRQEHYHNISSLLERYRSLKRTYAVFQEEFAEEITGIPINKSSNNLDIFDILSKRLDVLSVTEEKKFQKYYAPHITAGRKIGVALKALNFGLRILEAEDPNLYRLVNMVYIEDVTKPPIRDVCETMEFQSFCTYYARLDQAKKRLSELVFGYASNREELLSILVYLRQQTEDEEFPYSD